MLAGWLALLKSVLRVFRGILRHPRAGFRQLWWGRDYELCYRRRWGFCLEVGMPAPPYCDVHVALRGLRGRCLSALAVPAVQRRRRQPQLIISLASYALRIHRVHIALETLMTQSLKPDRIVLWLPEELRELPRSLRRLQRRGLDIRHVPDTGPYKKLIPALHTWPDALLVTADDDLIYPSTWLETLYRAWQREPDAIHCHNAKRIRLCAPDRVCAYGTWSDGRPLPAPVGDEPAEGGTAAALADDHCGPDFDLLPLNGAGTLFAPGFLHPEVANEDSFRALAPTADDLWFRAMSLRLRKKVRCLYRPALELQLVPDTQENALWHDNWSKNTGIADRLFEKYQLFDVLRS